ncbi:MAG: TetR/AcrR family transcriptional regulator [Bacteroidota bacterium]|jgi:AcrR family transcriptional regulator
MNKETISGKYMAWFAEFGTRPASVTAFCKKNKISETDFYQFFPSFEALEADILSGFAEQAWKALSEQDSFRDFSFQEKVLAYFFAFTEKLTENRSFLNTWAAAHPDPAAVIKRMHRFRKAFIKVADDMVNPAIAGGELSDRKFLNRIYPEALWLNLLLVFGYWFRDQSAGFEDTDALIEKSVQLTMELFGRNTLDKAVDLGKFLIGKTL